MVFAIVVACGLALMALAIAARAQAEVVRLRGRLEATTSIAPLHAPPIASTSGAAPHLLTVAPHLLTAPPSPADLMPAVEPPRRRPPASRASSPPGASLEERIGKHGGAWAGAIALLGAGGYYLRMASGRGWLGGGGKVAIALVLALIAIAVGERFMRRGDRTLGQGVLGAGLGIAFGALFAGHARYELYGSHVAVVVLALATVVGLTLAVRRDAPAIAVLAILGGYLTPALAGRGGDAGTPLCVYLTLLDLGVLGVAVARRWRGLEWLGFIGTWALFVGAHHQASPPALASSLAWGAWFFGLFIAVPLIHHARRAIAVTTDRLWLVTASGVVGFGFAVDVLPGQRTMAVAALAIAIGYLVTGWIVVHRLSGDGRARSWLGVLAVTFATVAVPLALDGHSIALAWAVEAPVLLGLGAHYRMAAVRHLGALVIGVAAAWLLGHAWPFHDGGFVPVLNRGFVTAALVAIAAGLYGAFGRRLAERALDPRGARLAMIVGIGAVAIAVAAIERELWFTVDLVAGPAAAPLAGLAWWLVVAATLAVRARGGAPRALAGALVVLAVAAVPLVMLVDQPVTGLPFANLRFVLAAGWAGLVLAIGVDWGRRSAGRGAELIVVGGLALFALVSREAWVQAAVRAGDPERAQWMAHAALSCAWAAAAAVILAVGFARRVAAVRHLGLALFALTVAKVVLFDLRAVAGSYRIGSLVVVGALLLSASWLYHRRGDHIDAR